MNVLSVLLNVDLKEVVEAQVSRLVAHSNFNSVSEVIMAGGLVV